MLIAEKDQCQRLPNVVWYAKWHSSNAPKIYQMCRLIYGYMHSFHPTVGNICYSVSKTNEQMHVPVNRRQMSFRIPNVDTGLHKLFSMNFFLKNEHESIEKSFKSNSHFRSFLSKKSNFWICNTTYFEKELLLSPDV